jgi:hypothetical protein
VIWIMSHIYFRARRWTILKKKSPRNELSAFSWCLYGKRNEQINSRFFTIVFSFCVFAVKIVDYDQAQLSRQNSLPSAASFFSSSASWVIHSFIHTYISLSQLSRHEGRSETLPALRETGKSVRVSLEEALSVARTLLYPLDLPPSYQPDVKPEQIDALRKAYGRLAKCEVQLSAFEDVVGEGEEDAMPSDAVPSDAVPSDAVPSDAVPSDAIRWFDHVVKQITTQPKGMVWLEMMHKISNSCKRHRMPSVRSLERSLLMDTSALIVGIAIQKRVSSRSSLAPI